MKTVTCAAAVILWQNTIYAAKRGHGTHIGWEFPGGKLEPHETSREAIIREIREELGALIEPVKMIHTIEHDYNDFHLSMDVWLCRLKEGEPHSNEHTEERWLAKDQLYEVGWLAADLTVIPVIEKLL
ncbi:MAG: (deoxy)nucleoside triphosphate pyrophosphohydrolase [Solobacterium sp.]|nr:(deoxy)nucleoside triphosphate pyrophosphohydrolase [Solobacterium sp.]